MTNVLASTIESPPTLEKVYYTPLSGSSLVQTYPGEKMLEQYLQNSPLAAYPLNTPFLVYCADDQVFMCVMTGSKDTRILQSLEEVPADPIVISHNKAIAALDLQTMTYPEEEFPDEETLRVWILSLERSTYTLNKSFHLIAGDGSRCSIFVSPNPKMELEDERGLTVIINKKV